MGYIKAIYPLKYGVSKKKRAGRVKPPAKSRQKSE